MADSKISALTELTGADVDIAADLLAIVDTSATTTKKIVPSNLLGAAFTTAGDILQASGDGVAARLGIGAAYQTLRTNSGATAAEWASPSVPQNAQNAGYTCVLADAGKHILMGTAGTFTIPANASVAYPIGTVITFVNGTTSCTIPITTDTMTLAGTSSTGTRTLAANGIATAIKTTATAWIISGSGLT